jgi:hypothetical protein
MLILPNHKKEECYLQFLLFHVEPDRAIIFSVGGREIGN